MFYICRKLEYSEKAKDQRQVTDKLDHIMMNQVTDKLDHIMMNQVHLTMSYN
jgi:hypothetical protein